MLGVTSGRTLGVDTESVVARDADIDGLDRYFAPEESAALLALPPRERRRRFFELWTLKESYIKARGMGLAIALDAFRFELGGERQRRSTCGPGSATRRNTGDSGNRSSWRLPCGVCTARGEGAPPRITVREIVPLSSERAVDITPARSTG